MSEKIIMQQYQGSCHCGAIHFLFEAAPFTCAGNDGVRWQEPALRTARGVAL